MSAVSPKLMTREEAGAYFKELRAKHKLRLQDVVDETTIPTVQYLSALEGGRYNPLNSEHFPSLVQFYRLSREEIERIRPGTIVEVVAPQQSAPGAPPIAPVVAFRDTPVVIPKELQQVIDEHGDRYPELRDPTIQKIVAAPRNFGGPDNGPQTVEDWYEYFLLTRRYLR